MIIFDLDGTLADCEHRRHFVDPEKNPDFSNRCSPRGQENMQELSGWYHLESNKKFKPNWKAFYEACDKDRPIIPVIAMLNALENTYTLGIEIWSARCESVRARTNTWLIQNGITDLERLKNLKMRPEGDSTPDDVLKEKWLDETLAQNKRVDYVFDDRPKVVRMWRSRGVFVFDVNQSGKEF